MPKGILIYAEIMREGYVAPVFFSLCAKAVELSKKLDNSPIYDLLIGKLGDGDKFKEGFTASGVDKAFVYVDDKLGTYSSEIYSSLLNLKSKQVIWKCH